MLPGEVVKFNLSLNLNSLARINYLSQAGLVLFRLQDLLSATRPVKPAQVSSTAILIQN